MPRSPGEDTDRRHGRRAAARTTAGPRDLPSGGRPRHCRQSPGGPLAGREDQPSDVRATGRAGRCRPAKDGPATGTTIVYRDGRAPTTVTAADAPATARAFVIASEPAPGPAAVSAAVPHGPARRRCRPPRTGGSVLDAAMARARGETQKFGVRYTRGAA